MPLQPTASLPSLLRCIIQCFSHNRLRSEGLSLPQPCVEQSANMEEALDPRLRLRAGCCRLFPSLAIAVRFIQPAQPWT